MACRGDETARSGYDFVDGGKGRTWPVLKELHDNLIFLLGECPLRA